MWSRINKTDVQRGAAVSAETGQVARRKAPEDDGEPTGSKRRRATSSNVEMPTRSGFIFISLHSSLISLAF